MDSKGPIRLALLGAGKRGALDLGYHIAKLPDHLKYVAVAEPDPHKRDYFVHAYDIPKQNAFDDWAALLAEPQLADAVVNALPCRFHHDSTTAALNAGYHVFLEKPMALTAGECVDLVRAADESRRVLVVSFEFRYAPINREIFRHLHNGEIGKLVSVSCTEDIGHWLYATDFVRGVHQSAEAGSSFMMAKGIHDVDLLQWWIGARPVNVASFGELSFFNGANAPDGATERCTDDCPVRESCVFDALKLYVEPGHADFPLSLITNMSLECLIDYVKNPHFRTFASVISPDVSKSNILEQLRKGNHGRCVFHSDNTIADHQTTIIEFENGITCSLALSGLSLVWERNCIFNGSKAELQAADFSGKLELRTYKPAKVHRKRIRYHGILHGGGDTDQLRDFAEAVRGGNPDRTILPAGESALESHLLALAAEEARRTKSVVHIDAFRQKAEQEATSLAETASRG